MNGLAKRAGRVLVVAILLWGALAVLARLATPLLQHYREPIAAWLGEQAGMPVHIGQLRASWYGVWPRLRLNRVRLGDGEESINLAQIDVELSPGGLFNGRPVDDIRLTLTGLDVHVRRETSGQVHVVGLPLPQADNEPRTEDAPPALTLPSQLRLLNTRLHWQDLRVDAAPIVIDHLNLDLRRDGRNLRLRAALNSPLGEVDLGADVSGFLSSTDWSGSSYLQVRGLELVKLVEAYLPAHYRLHNGRLDLELWQQWRDAKPVDARGTVAFRNIDFANTQPQPQHSRLKRVSSNFLFTRSSEQQWRLNLHGVQFEPLDAPAWPSGRIAVQRTLRDGRAWIRARAEHLVLDQLAELLLIHPPNQATGEALRGLRPRGRAHDLRLQIPLDGGDDWAASITFEDLAIDAWQDIPGIANLAGQVSASASHSSVQLDAREVPLDYTSLFRYPLQLTRLQGTVHLLSDDSGWEVRSDRLDMQTADLRTATRLSLRKTGDRPLHLDLVSNAFDGDVAATPKYLPAAIMGKKLVHWLDASLSTGRLDSATTLVSGPLADFPYNKVRNGSFEVVGLAKNVPLNYQTGWPALKDVSALLMFHENSLDIELISGSIYNSRISHAHASIRSLHPTSSLLARGQLSGPLQDELTLLREPALHEDFGHIAEALEVGGNAEVTLDIEVPLVSGLGEYRLDGALLFKNAKLSLTDWDLALDRINGELGITLDSLQARGIRARAFGAPLVVDVLPQPDKDLRIRARGSLSREALNEQLPQLPLQLAEGSADFTIDLDIPGISAEADAPTVLAVSSDLAGMRIDLPEPLGKKAGDTRQLAVSLGVAGRPQAARIRYGDSLNALFSADWQRGEVRYRSGDAQLPPDKGYRLHANFDHLDLSTWSELPSRIGGSDDELDWLADIRARHLSFAGMTLEQTALVLRGDSQAIQGTIASPRLSGRFNYPKDPSLPLDIQLEKAHLVFETEQNTVGEADAQKGPQAPSAPPTPAREPDPRKIPELSLNCSDLRLNRAEFGNITLQSVPSAQGMQINQIVVQGPSISIAASGAWEWRDDTQYTHLAGAFVAPDFGELLDRLGYARHMHEARASTGFDLKWPGHPGQFHIASIDGTLDLDVGKGRFARLDPGITRVVGLLNIDALTRRLTLDFSDLVKKGYSFDLIQGRFHVRDADAFTNDLLIKGASGRIEVGGRIGLVENDFDLLVNVTPNLDATLPLAGTLAGGPIGGIAALVAQTLMSDQVDDINRFEYSVTGGWDEPTITPLDSGGAVSQLLNKLSGQQTEAKTQQQEGLIQRDDDLQRNPLQQLLDKLPDTQSGPGKDSDPLRFH